MIHAHSNPLVLTAADIMIEDANKKRQAKFMEYLQLTSEEEKQKFIKNYESRIPKWTPIQILKAKTWKMMILKKFPNLEQFLTPKGGLETSKELD